MKSGVLESASKYNAKVENEAYIADPDQLKSALPHCSVLLCHCVVSLPHCATRCRTVLLAAT